MEQSEWLVRSAAATDLNTPVDELANLAADNSPDVRMLVAANSSTPTEVLATLAADPEFRVRSHAAGNEKTPGTALSQLGTESDWFMRRTVAGNPSTPVSTLTELAADDQGDIQVAVAKNSSTPINLLELLASDPKRWVRAAVAANPHTPAEVLDALSADHEEQVRASVASNPNTNMETLTILATELVRSGSAESRQMIASNPKAPKEILLKLVSDKSVKVRNTAAANPSIPSSAKEIMKLSPLDQGLTDIIKATTAAELSALQQHKTKAVQGAALIRSMELGFIPAAEVRTKLKGSSGTSTTKRYLGFATGYDMNQSLGNKWVRPSAWSERSGSMADDVFINICLDLHHEDCLVSALAAGLQLQAEHIERLGATKQFQWAKMTLLKEMANDPDQSAAVMDAALALKADSFLANLIQRQGANHELLEKTAQAGLAQSTWEAVQKLPLDQELLRVISTVPSWSVATDSEPELSQLTYPGSVAQGSEWTTFHTQHIAATHQLTPQETLTQLVKAKSAFVRAGLATRPDLDPALAGKLAKDKDAAVRAALASNPSCPEELLLTLASDSESHVRGAVSNNLQATPEIKAVAALLG